MLELSSFQLETVLFASRRRGVVVLNLTPDHLDRYPSVEVLCVRAKAKLVGGGCPATGAVVLNYGGPATCGPWAPLARGRVLVVLRAQVEKLPGDGVTLAG